MQNNFWQNLKDQTGREERPILALAPMAGITDSAFRVMCKKYGADVVYSEMASVNALVYAPEKTLEMLAFEEVERPYVVQLFGSEPRHFEIATKIIEEKIKPDGIDINFGCPVPKVAKQEAGAELFKNLKKSKDVIKAVLNSTELPVSIKFRKKVGEMDAMTFLKNISGLDIKAIMIHGRDFKQMHSGPVDAEVIRQARDYFSGTILANGGVKDADSGLRLRHDSRADGIGIGQGALGRPWLFKFIKSQVHQVYQVDKEELFKVIFEHCELMQKNKGPQGLIEMRKHLCWYVQGFPNAARLRERLVKVETLQNVLDVFQEISRN